MCLHMAWKKQSIEHNASRNNEESPVGLNGFVVVFMAEIRLRSNSGIVTEARKCLNSPNVPKISIQFWSCN